MSQTTSSHMLPKSHSLLAVPRHLWHQSPRADAPPTLSQRLRQADSQEEEEDLSLDLPTGENWMCLMTSSPLLSTQASQSLDPIAPYASIHPLTASLSLKQEPPSLFPGDSSTLKGSFLMIDIDEEFCTVKDIRIKPPCSDESDEQTSDSTTHYRFSICRCTQTLQLPATWDHFSFTRRSCHLQPGDRLVLWETSDRNASAVPTTEQVCSVWEKAYQATVETGDEEEMMVSQLEVEDANTTDHEEGVLTQEEQMLLTQGTAARGSSLTSPPLATQPESPKRPNNDQDEDDVTVDPREDNVAAAATSTELDKTPIRGKTDSQHARDTADAQQALQPDIRACVAMASRLRDEGSQLIASTPQKKSTKLNLENLRSPNLLDDDSSVEGESSQHGTAPVDHDKSERATTPKEQDSQETETESESSPARLTKNQKPRGLNETGPSTEGDKSGPGQLPSLTESSNQKDKNHETTKNPWEKKLGEASTHDSCSRIDEAEEPNRCTSSQETRKDSQTKVPIEHARESLEDDRTAGNGVEEESTVEKLNNDETRPVENSLAATETEHSGAKGVSDIEGGPTSTGEVSGGKLTLAASASEERSVPNRSSQSAISDPKKLSNARPHLRSEDTTPSRVPEEKDDRRENAVNESTSKPASSGEVKSHDYSGDTAASRSSITEMHLCGKRKLAEASQSKQSGDGNHSMLEPKEESPRKIQRNFEKTGSGAKNANGRQSSLADTENMANAGPISKLKQSCHSSPRNSQAVTVPTESKVEDLSGEGTDDAKDAASHADAHRDDPETKKPTSEETVGTAKDTPTEAEQEEETAGNKTKEHSCSPEARSTRTSTRREASAPANPPEDDAMKRKQPRRSRARRHEAPTVQAKGDSALGDVDESASARGVAMTRAAKSASKDNKDSKKRKEHVIQEKIARTTRRKTATQTPISKATKNKRSPRTRRTKTEHPMDEDVPPPTDEIYLLATGCDNLKKRELAGLQSLGMTMLDADNPDEWGKVTHLLVDEKTTTKRTAKVMIGMCQAKHVCTTAWLRACLEREEVVPMTGLVDDKVRQNPDVAKRITNESLQRAADMRNSGRYILSDCAISLCKGVAGEKAPSLDELRCICTNAGSVWLGEGVPNKKMEGKRTIVITSDPSSRSQKKSLESRGEGVEAQTTSWLFESIMLQSLDR